MKTWFISSWQSALAIIITATVIYLLVMILTRIFGLRSFSKMSSFDFAMTVAIGSLIATTVVSHSVSLMQGAVGILSVYLLQLSVARLRRLKVVAKLVDNRPLLLMEGEQILEENMKSARVTRSDLIAKLREANVIHLSQVKAVVMETTGDISVLHSDKAGQDLAPLLLEDVRRTA